MNDLSDMEAAKASGMTEGMRGIPMPSPDRVARTIADALLHPRREVVVPGYYRLAIWLERALPGLADVLLGTRNK